MSDFVGNQIRARLTEQLIDEIVKKPRALTIHEAALLAKGAWHWRHLSAHFDAKVRNAGVPYVDRELELRPDGECPFCGQNVRVERAVSTPNSEATTDL